MSDATTLGMRICAVCVLLVQVSRPGAVKGPWQKHEDEIILKCLEEGVTKWSDIADRVTGRIGKQCRERFFNHLDRECSGGLSLPSPPLHCPLAVACSRYQQGSVVSRGGCDARARATAAREPLERHRQVPPRPLREQRQEPVELGHAPQAARPQGCSAQGRVLGRGRRRARPRQRRGPAALWARDCSGGAQAR